MESWDQFLRVAPDFLLKFFVAILCGGAIGMDRERLGKPAGLRTNVLICVGSMLYTEISVIFTQLQPGFAGSFDPSRVAAQIVTGIGFLGAGSILQSRGMIMGLTSAAMIWTVGAIGIVIGTGYIFVAIGTTAAVVLTLLFLGKIEPRILGKCHFAHLVASFRDDPLTRQAVVEILHEHDVEITQYTIDREDGRFLVRLTYCDRHPSHSRHVTLLQNLDGFLTAKSVDVV